MLGSELGALEIAAYTGVCSRVQKTDIKPVSIEFTYTYKL